MDIRFRLFFKHLDQADKAKLKAGKEKESSSPGMFCDNFIDNSFSSFC